MLQRNGPYGADFWQTPLPKVSVLLLAAALEKLCFISVDQ